MDWHGNSRTSLVSRPPEQHHLHQPSNDNPIGFFYNNYSHDQYRGMELNRHGGVNEPPYGEILAAMNRNIHNNDYENNQDMKKKIKMTSDQLESLERSFQEEIKLDPSRKMKLSRELGLQPRQIAVWFQNRRARWKSKQLEHLYDALKQEYDATFREKLKLQEEVMRLKAMIRDQAPAGIMKQVSIGYTDMSAGEVTVESRTSINVGGSSLDKQQGGVTMNHLTQIADSYYPLNNGHGYHNAGSSSCYGVFTTFP